MPAADPLLSPTNSSSGRTERARATERPTARQFLLLILLYFGLQLFLREREAGVDQPKRGPHVVFERVIQQGSAHAIHRNTGVALWRSAASLRLVGCQSLNARPKNAIWADCSVCQ